MAKELTTYFCKLDYPLESGERAILYFRLHDTAELVDLSSHFKWLNKPSTEKERIEPVSLQFSTTSTLNIVYGRKLHISRSKESKRGDIILQEGDRWFSFLKNQNLTSWWQWENYLVLFLLGDVFSIPKKQIQED